jgi:putative transposase
MPKKVMDYVSGLLCVSEQATCTALARVTGRSHDSLSRTLKSTKFVWQTLLRALTLRVFGKLSGGYLIIDDVVLKKSYAKAIENLSWIYCSKEQRSVLGLNLVVICWSNDIVIIPLGFKVWEKGNKKSKYDLALELLSYARNILKIKPEYVTFDSWYSAKKILKRLQRYGWTFYSQLKKNRKFNGVQVSKFSSTRFWTSTGKIDSSFEVVVIKHCGKYFATNDLTADKYIILKKYKTRWKIETCFRMLQYKLGIDECQMIPLKAQIAHAYMTMMSLVLLEKIRTATNQTWYQTKRQLTFHPKTTIPLLSKLGLVGA